MKIAIVGAGAMGCLYGSRLSVTGHEIWLLDIMEEHMETIRRNGLTVLEKNKDGFEETYIFRHLKATTKPDEIGQVDLALIFVKSTITHLAVINNRAIFGPDTLILTLQNGLGNVEDILSASQSTNIIAGTTAHGASMLGPGKIRHSGIGKTIIGELSGESTDRILSIAQLFNAAGLETEVSENVLGLIWDKLLVNVGINALTAITGLQNGKLVLNREIEELLELLVAEAQMVAQVKGICLNFPDPITHTKQVCRATGENISSMLQDILNHRKTEIDQINGAIIKEGKLLGIDTPVNVVLRNLVKAKETDYEGLQ